MTQPAYAPSAGRADHTVDRLSAIEGPGTRGAAGEGAGVLRAMREALRVLVPASEEGESIDRIALLEDIKSAAAAGQLREIVAFAETRQAREAEAGVPASRRGRGLAAEIALAMRHSPARGSRTLSMARTLEEDMPHAMEALNKGALSEWDATCLLREVIALPSEARSEIDHAMASRYPMISTGRLAGEARALANQVNPAAQAARHAAARGQRRVTVRPAPASMAYLTAHLPVAQAFACKKALMDAAATGTAAGHAEARSQSQMEADTLVERLTGQHHSDALPVELHLVMTDTAVFGTNRGAYRCARGTEHDVMGRCPPGGTSSAVPMAATIPPSSAPDPAFPVVDEDGRLADPAMVSAWIPGYGPIPAPLARDLLDPRHDHGGPVRAGDPPGREPPSRERVFLRRVMTDPITGEIAALDTRARAFTGALRRALILRDGVCRTPWCGAPIAHIDHTQPYAAGGATSYANGSGVCARCNYTKENPGWSHANSSATALSSHTPDFGSRRTGLTVATPTGHHYESRPPPLLPQLVRRE